ncbi:N-methyltransferase [Pseudozyma hubeiensis SY62]|uniref:N-methyltransferase n=1 Tax=Pseudozyma hubeiensis (strain SY62) TaxID=1305764 RepID=R9P553_PSEHS|nr:N-methyltransferase [Pseudozyma hubeiensis SY62]GAC96439.1 N-methyltransferase [Pseudozyma hubeiensis SY62]
MASTSGASVSGGSAAQHIDVDDVEHGVGSGISTIATEVVDDEMAGDATSAAQGTQTPLSTNTEEPQDESDMAASFYQSTSTGSHKRQSVSKPANSHPIVVHDQDEDDLMEPDLPGREERVGAFAGQNHAAVLLATAFFSPQHSMTDERFDVRTATRREDQGSLYSSVIVMMRVMVVVMRMMRVMVTVMRVMHRARFVGSD